MRRSSSIVKPASLAAVSLAFGLCMFPTLLLAQSETGTGKSETTGTAKKEKETAKNGNDRWLVKTASDLDINQVTTKPVKTTVESMLEIPRPADLSLQETGPWLQNHRAAPAETTIWSVEADVTRCQLMPDGDYRITIRGATGKTMVLEMPNPDPKFVDTKSPFAQNIKSARAEFDAREHPERAAKEITRHAVISGIGFFARAHGKVGESPGNLIQLHPVLKIEWLAKPTQEFIAGTEQIKSEVNQKVKSTAP